MRVTANSQDNLKVEVKARDFVFFVDQPVPGMNENAGPTPYEVLYGSLASCKVIMMKMYAMQRGWDLGDVQVNVDFHPATEKDMDVDNLGGDKKSSHAHVEVFIGGDLDDEQKAKLISVSKKCPVHLTLDGEVVL